jgi:subtilase family serine protease
MLQKYTKAELLDGFDKQFSESAAKNSHPCDFVALRSRAPCVLPFQSMYIPPAKEVSEYIVKNLNKNEGPGVDNVSVQAIQNAGPSLIKIS